MKKVDWWTREDELLITAKKSGKLQLINLPNPIERKQKSVMCHIEKVASRDIS